MFLKNKNKRHQSINWSGWYSGKLFGFLTCNKIVTANGNFDQISRIIAQAAQALSKNHTSVASVSVGLGRKDRPWNGILPARNWGESQNKKEGVGEGKEGGETGI